MGFCLFSDAFSPSPKDCIVLTFVFLLNVLHILTGIPELPCYLRDKSHSVMVNDLFMCN